MISLVAYDASWPGLSRPSTPCFANDHKDVDARDKPGHDENKEGPGKTGAFDLARRWQNQRE
jgi:hypothetical protein